MILMSAKTYLSFLNFLFTVLLCYDLSVKPVLLTMSNVEEDYTLLSEWMKTRDRSIKDLESRLALAETERNQYKEQLHVKEEEINALTKDASLVSSIKAEINVKNTQICEQRKKLVAMTSERDELKQENKTLRKQANVLDELRTRIDRDVTLYGTD